ncbi:dopamine receptor 1-like [Macrosteles quadrilineatus]|uniref:dopamine receptor 1-like n=1 Tax=Macrosteles quadrilineatus TaxID=74068 RepID=UPI0023E1EC4D|nr:dopamine receptor 1-like [Macrosteles quadrilineatus]
MLNTLSVILIALGILLLVTVCIVGNLLVCLAIYHDSRLRRTENLFIASLAVADLLVAGVMIMAGINDLLGRWVFGAKLCHIWIAVDIMCCTASIFNLCAIALDRYTHIKDPFRYPVVVTRRVVLSSIALVWVVSGGVSLVSLWFHRSSVLSYCSLDLAPVYAVVSSLISFCIPCLVMAAIYSRLYLLSRHHCQSIANTHIDHKAAVTIGIIMGIFLACWLPFFCANILDAFYPDYVSSSLFKLLTWLGYSNSVFNPIVYSVLNKEFRECFKLIVMRRLSKQSVKTISSITS